MGFDQNFIPREALANCAETGVIKTKTSMYLPIYCNGAGECS